MSYAVHALPVINVSDPRIMVDQKKEYTVLRGAQEVSFQQFPANNTSNSNAVFMCNPPGPGFIVDKYIKLTMPGLTCNFSASTNTSAPAVGLLNSQGDAPRAYPLATVMDTLQLYLNNNSITLPVSDIIQPMLRFHNPCMTQNGIYSMTPSEMDHTQDYLDLYEYIQNPLSGYGDSVWGGAVHRGAFPYDSYTNVAGATTAQVVFSPTEPLFISPLNWGPVITSGLIGVQTMQVNITWSSGALFQRIWSHADIQPAVGAITGWNVTPNFANPPKLEFCYMTPKITQAIPRSVSYPYYSINRYNSTVSSISVAPLQTYQMTLQNIQFSQIPRRAIMFVMAPDNTLTFETPDVYYPITNLSINFDNRQNLLASAQTHDLYYMNLKNGYNGSWNDFIGGPATDFNRDYQYGLSGAPLVVEFGTDIGLSPDLSAGVSGTFQFQITATFKNPNPNATLTQATLWVIEVDEGLVTIENNSMIVQTSVLSKADVLNAHDTHPWVSYETLMRPEGGASFFDKLKSIASTVLPVAQNVCKGVSAVSPFLGRGEGMGEGGILVGDGMRRHKTHHRKHGGLEVGGRHRRRSNLHRRMRH